jgi:tRNA G37 N-methylase TrmD
VPDTIFAQDSAFLENWRREQAEAEEHERRAALAKQARESGLKDEMKPEFRAPNLWQFLTNY